MQKTATKVFIGASIIFGIVGILMIVAVPSTSNFEFGLGGTLRKILLADVCIILPSFALAVAGKYLNK